MKRRGRCGKEPAIAELKEVERILTERPEAACEPGGSKGWTPLLYLCYTRFSYPPTIANALAISKHPLAHGRGFAR
jgi:hypothetical protein